MKVLVIGAGGVFGSRLAQGLVRHGFEVVTAGRDLDRAQAAARALVKAFPDARVEAVALDTRTLAAETLAATGADLVADAAGPFQGAEPRVAAAAIAAGLHYVDLADGRDFVAGFPDLDSRARAAGVVALTGCSSTPALSHAVLDQMTAGWREVVTVEAAISPGARAPRGLSVMQAILSWLGQPVRVFEDGRWCDRRGWSGLHRRDFGRAGRRVVSLCETPDLDLLHTRFSPRQGALFLAGLSPGLLHGLAWLLSIGVGLTGRSARPLAGALTRLAEPFAALGSDRGAMRVEAVGVDGDGRFAQAIWRLTAEPGEGPVTPSLPAIAAIRAIERGEVKPGARPCTGEIGLDAIVAEMAPHGLTTESDVRRALFARAMGPAFDSLPDQIRALHETPGRSEWRGEARTQGAANILGRLIAGLFGFPGGRTASPVTVELDANGDRSIWRRTIGASRFQSTLSRPRAGGHIEERFGPFTMALRLRPEAGQLWYEMTGWRLGPIPLPAFLAPRTLTHERVDEQGRFVFDVEIGLPVVGRLVRYTGWLRRSDAEPQAPSRVERR